MSEIIEARGFRMDIDPIRVIVDKDYCAFNRKERYSRALLLVGSMSFSCIWLIVQAIRESHELRGPASPSNAMTWIFSLLAAALPITLVVQKLYPGKDEVIWTKESVQVRTHFVTRATRARTFAASEVEQVKYLSNFPCFGPSSRIIFHVKREWVSISRGIHEVDARRILTELSQMGFNVVDIP